MISHGPLHIALSTDAKGHPYHATLIASILRRTASPVHVRCWCRGFLPESFETGPLKVEFIAATDEVKGTFPGYVGPAVFDRLRVINETGDWQRCLIMDYDQLVLCDLAPLFDLEMGDALLAAKMQGSGVDMTYAMREYVKRPMPDGWDHVAGYPYFSMGPLLNLAAMRDAGTWEKVLAAQAAFGMDEQLALTAATDGRTIGYDRKWNLFPKSDIPEGDVPDGVVHWLGWPKPWHPGAKVWRPDIWHAERASWEHLRLGIWDKPMAVEIEPEDGRHVRALLERGWKVRVVNDRACEPQVGAARYPEIPDFPDLEFVTARPGEPLMAGTPDGRAVDMVRVGPWIDAPAWLGPLPRSPHVVLRGAVPAEEIDAVVALGYGQGVLLDRADWPTGGPLPRVLATTPLAAGTSVGPGQDVVLAHGASAPADRAANHAAPVARRRVQGKSIGLVMIATGKYTVYVPPLLRSVRRNFLPDHEVRVVLFTDSGMQPEPDVQVIPIASLQWPEPAMQRYDLLANHRKLFEGMEYLYYIDADMRVVDTVGDEILGDLVATIHPGFADKPRERYTYESRRESTARVGRDEGIGYYAGAFQGGRTPAFLAAAEAMAQAIAVDSANGITAVWHDESHWNRYLIDHPPTLALTPSYCHYPDGRSAGYEPKIQVVLKDAAMMRAG